MKFQKQAIFGALVAGVVIAGTVGAVDALASSTPKRTSVAVQASTTLTHPPADIAARQLIEHNVMAIGSPQISAVQIKGSTWGTFVSQSGYSSQIPDPTAVAALSTPVYVEVITGRLSFDEPTPNDPHPAQSPWMASVLNASNDHPLFETAGNPGSGLPAWYTSMVDQSV